MKKIIKILMVCLITINFVFANTVKTKAIEYKYPSWFVSYIAVNNTTGNKITNTGGETIDGVNSVAYGISLETGYAISLINIVFKIQLKPGETVNLTYDMILDGLRPYEYGIKYRAWVVSNSNKQFDIPIPTLENSDFYYEESSSTEYKFINQVQNYKYTNETNETIDRLYVQLNMTNSQNLLYILVSFNDLTYYVTKSDAVLNEENNQNISGIFEYVKNIFTSITNLPSNIANSVKGFFDNIVNAVNKIQTWLVNLLDGIIQGLKSLFIPSDDYFKNYFDSLYDFFSEKLGILIMPLDILISLFENIMNLENGDGYIHVPNFEFMGVNLIPKTDYNLKVDVEKVLGNYYDMYYLLTDVIIYFMLFNMAKKKFEAIVGGTSE